jgi:ubiquinol-cytochrome c reductase cytochrome c1 subunit
MSKARKGPIMNKKTLLAIGLVCAISFGAGSAAFAAEYAPPPPRLKWSFSGPFGKFDKGQLQRGLKVYREVCQACHSLNLVAFRTLGQSGALGFSEGQIKTLAGEYQITDGPNDTGEMFQRPGRPSDYFPKIFANEQAARATHNGALPVDLSVIAKARTYEVGFPGFLIDIVRQYQENGVDYLHALLTGYENPPAGVELPPTQFWNKYYPGNRIAMRPPLEDNRVEYSDGTPQTVDQYSRDVTAFLMWAAEPHLEARKRIGFQVIIFLIVFAGLAYFTKKKVWASAH